MMKKRKGSKKKSSISNKHPENNAQTPTEVNELAMTSEMMSQVYEGQLYKYTNVMKGWQFRWFILDPKTGVLNYYLENERKQPRGWVRLEAAVINPSDEDSNTFTVNSSSGEVFKLRAQDARARQEWVNRLRAVAQFHSSNLSQNPSLGPRDPGPASSASSSYNMSLIDAFSGVREHLCRAEQSSLAMAREIDDLPTTGSLRHIDKDLLMLKAATQAMLLSLGQCWYILHHQTLTNPTGKAIVKSSSKSDSASHTSKKK